VGVERGSKLYPKKFSVFSLFGQKGLGPEVVCGKEPVVMEHVETVKDGKIHISRK
jgi:hypothetical protein